MLQSVQEEVELLCVLVVVGIQSGLRERLFSQPLVMFLLVWRSLELVYTILATGLRLRSVKNRVWNLRFNQLP